MIRHDLEKNFKKEYIIIMTIDKKSKDEELQYDINKQTEKIRILLTGKIDKYKYLTGEEIFPSGPFQVIVQAKFTYFPLGKALENQTKIIKYQTKIIKDKKSNTQ